MDYLLDIMGVDINAWRARIGRFSGGGRNPKTDHWTELVFNTLPDYINWFSETFGLDLSNCPELCLLVQACGIRLEKVPDFKLKAVPLFISNDDLIRIGLPAAVIQYLLSIAGIEPNPGPG